MRYKIIIFDIYANFRAFLSAVSSKYLNSYANDALDLVLQLANPTEELITLGKQLLRSETPLDERVNLAK